MLRQHDDVDVAKRVHERLTALVWMDNQPLGVHRRKSLLRSGQDVQLGVVAGLDEPADRFDTLVSDRSAQEAHSQALQGTGGS